MSPSASAFQLCSRREEVAIESLLKIFFYNSLSKDLQVTAKEEKLFSIFQISLVCIVAILLLKVKGLTLAYYLNPFCL